MAPSALTAVLGPTNTGKTHLAMERFLAHPSGMIGFPLRLLARENYERAAKAKGRHAVALITGEEKIVPPGARHFVCTVEAMPVDRPVAFLAVDEIQLSADPERGHVFTERLLSARGLEETMFLGSDSMRDTLRRLLPGIEIVSRPRLSTLTHIGHLKLTRLPPRSAVVGFSAAAVYEMAELLRRTRGGAAIVMGALSPRTRNAQVALYQEGAVDFLVATDAIGMGLNLDVGHVAFAGLSKFDGRRQRPLTVPELSQIAGRAGRHARDGSFGTTGSCPPLEPEIVSALEEHRVPPVETLVWRNPDLDFRSLGSLIRSLEKPPPAPGLTRLREGDDHRALLALAHDAAIAGRIAGRAEVELLWQVCRIPDFEQGQGEGHARLLGRIFALLLDHGGQLPSDWLAGQIERLHSTLGEIDALTERLARVRSFTYLAHSTPFLPDPELWQARAQAVEDRLSDALHDRLTQRFIDRRSAGLIRSLSGGGPLMTGLSADGRVTIEGVPAGRLTGLDFSPEPDLSPEQRRLIDTAARRSLTAEVTRRGQALASAPDEALILDAEDRIVWQGEAVARLVRGPSPDRPGLAVIAGDWLDGGLKAKIGQHLSGWLGRQLERLFKPLDETGDLPAEARALLFRLRPTLGTLVRTDDIRLPGPARRALEAKGVRIGRDHVYVESMLKPAALDWRARLWRIAGHRAPPLPPMGRMSAPAAAGHGVADWRAVGHVLLGGLAVRVDMAERLAAAVAAETGDFTARPEWAALIGAPRAKLPAVLTALGHTARPDGTWRTATLRRIKGEPLQGRLDPDSPFALFRAKQAGAHDT